METDTLDQFEEWWNNSVKTYAEKMNLPLSYVEEEFIIDGELVEVDVTV